MRGRMIRRGKRRYCVWLVALTGMFGLLSTSCRNNPFEGMIVAVAMDSVDESSYEGAKLIAIDPKNSEKAVSVLSNDFQSACSPALSHDGRHLYFQGKLKKDDPWQIWVMDLHKKSASQVTELPDHCTNPASLPDGTLVFSRSGSTKDVRTNALYRCKMDGTGLVRITYSPNSNLHSSILRDGRVLYTSSQRYPDVQDPVLMVMRPDGTKAEIFYRGIKGSFPVSKGIESDQGFVYFIETNGEEQMGGDLIRIHQNRPLYSRVDLSSGISGLFKAVIPWEENCCLISFQSSSNETFALYTLDSDIGSQPVLLYRGDGHITDPVYIAAMQERPRILPSAVNPDNPTGLLMSQNINHSAIPSNPMVKGDTLADRIEVFGLDGIMGETVVKEDGSFYLEIDADTPIRFLTLNKQGETVRGPSEWIWIRPNERRGCVGCHADPELAPENIQPLAVQHSPAVISAFKKENSNQEEAEQ